MSDTLSAVPAGAHQPVAALKLLFYLPDLAGGGAERLTLTLCRALSERGHRVTLVVDRLRGENVARIPDGLDVLVLEDRAPGAAAVRSAVENASRLGVLLDGMSTSRKPYFMLRRTVALARILADGQYDVLVAALGYTPFIAHWARAFVASATAVVVVEHNTPSKAFLADDLSLRQLLRLNQVKTLMRRVYPRLDARVAVSDGVAEDTAEFVQMERRRFRTIYNPVAVDEIEIESQRACEHPWIADDDTPVIVTAGRLVAQKNQRLLLDALARLRHNPAVRLIILGEGPLRASLEQHAMRLGIADRVDMPGWVANPYTFMRGADVFVQSSDREGLSLVLIEALACGASVVSTDCQSGPREILDEGRYGRLVPTHDADALAEAIDATLATPRADDSHKNRAAEFSVDRSASAYEELMYELTVSGRR